MKLALFGIDINFDLDSLSIESAKSLKSYGELLSFSGGERTLVLISAQMDQIETIFNSCQERDEIISILVGTEDQFESAAQAGILSDGFLVAPVVVEDIEELLSDYTLTYRPVEVDPSDFDESNKIEETMPNKKNEIELGDFSGVTIDINQSDLASEEIPTSYAGGIELAIGEESEVLDITGIGDDSDAGISLEELGDNTGLEISTGEDEEDEVEDEIEFDLSPDDSNETNDDGSSSINFQASDVDETTPMVETDEDATGGFTVDLSAADDSEVASGPIEFGYKADDDNGAEHAGNTTEFSVDGDEEEDDEEEIDFSTGADEEEVDDDEEIDFSTGADEDDEDDEEVIDFSTGESEDNDFELSDDEDIDLSDDKDSAIEIPNDLPEDDIPTPEADKSVTKTVLNCDELSQAPVQERPAQATIIRNKIDYTFDENEMVRLQLTIRSMKEEREMFIADVDVLKSTKAELEQNNLGLKAEADDLKIELALLKKRHGEQIEEASYQLRLSEDRKILNEERVRKMQIDFDQLNQKVRIDLNKVTHKEKELESQLELIKMDSDAQIKGRDQKIMELKRKIDSLEFNMENMAIKEQKSKDDHEKVEIRVQKVMKTLKGTMKLLEDDIDFAITDRNKGDNI